MRSAIIALGNPLMGDDGAGPAALEHLRGADLPPDVVLLEGSTAGFGLLHMLADVDVVVLVDAADFGGTPGQIRTFTPAEVCSHEPGRARLSLHGGDVLQIVALAERLGACPERLSICAIQPARIAPVQCLTASVAAGLPALAEEVVRTLRRMVNGSKVS